MREIKFRGKRLDNGEWVYGWYREWVMPELWKHQGYRNGINYYIDNKETNESYLVIPETVGQFTGLTDKNGKEIYEGDLLKFDCFGPQEVVFYEGRFSVIDHDGFSLFRTSIWGSVGEIIGNIHDQKAEV